MIQRNSGAGPDAGVDTEFYLAGFSSYPLLRPGEERETDLRKWAAVRSCIRLLANDAAGRELLLEFCEACLNSPPNPETFKPRSSYSVLRKDIVDLLPGKPGAALLATLQEQIECGAAVAAVMKSLDKAALPATLAVGLATLELRSLGMPFRDASADALLAWKVSWSRRRRPANPRLAADLRHSVLRYLANRDRLVQHNVRLVYKLARENQNRSIPLPDLVQEGCAGLVRAAEKFNYRLGYRFSTYAYNWINQHISRACGGNGSLITYPAHVQQHVNQLHRLRTDFRERTGREPAAQTLAEMAGLPVEKVRSLRALTNITQPLDEPFAEDGSLTWASILPDMAGEQPADAAQDMLVSRIVGRKLRSLGALEQKVLQRRFGLHGGLPQTLRQLADELGISSEWARQLEITALAKLRDDEGMVDLYRELEA